MHRQRQRTNAASSWRIEDTDRGSNWLLRPSQPQRSHKHRRGRGRWGVGGGGVAKAGMGGGGVGINKE